MDLQEKIQKGGTLFGHTACPSWPSARGCSTEKRIVARRATRWPASAATRTGSAIACPAGRGQLGVDETRVTDADLPRVGSPIHRTRAHRDEHRDRHGHRSARRRRWRPWPRSSATGSSPRRSSATTSGSFVPPARLIDVLRGPEGRVRLRRARRAGRDRLPRLSRAGRGRGSRSITCSGTSTPRERLVVKTGVDDPDPTLPSVVPLWQGADWMEREVFDMYGISVRRPPRPAAHPDARRVHRLPAAEGLPAPRPGRAAQLPAADARRVVNGSVLAERTIEISTRVRPADDRTACHLQVR